MLRLSWEPWNEVVPEANAFGYTSASVNLRDALARRKDVLITPNADICVWVCHPFNFRPEQQPWKRQILFTMYEAEPPPPEFASAMYMADAVFTPSRYCVRMLRPFAFNRPVKLSHLGYDPEVYRYVERRWTAPKDDGPFRWLWIGAPNERKGYDILVEAWKDFLDQKWMRLYMKTNAEEGHPDWHFTRWNQEFDNRRLPRREMAELYGTAHAFLFPSRGEGFGLTALEAAATGLPIVTIDYGGTREFLDRRTAWIVPSARQLVATGSTLGVGVGARGKTVDFQRAMIALMRDYPAALRIGREAAKRARANFTWDHAAEAFVQNVRALGWREAV